MAVTVSVRAGGSNTNDVGLAPVVVLQAATTCDIGSANSNYVQIAGTARITSLGNQPNKLKIVEFLDSPTLIASADLTLPGGGSITASAEDTCIVVSDDDGAWSVVAYQRADGTALVSPDTPAPLADNLLGNGGFAINQRGRSTVGDGDYDFDRWYVLTESGQVGSGQLTDPEVGAAFASRLTQSQASAQRLGRAQIIESADCRHLRSGHVTLSGRAALSAGGVLRFAILEWTGAADAVTRDVVANWGASTYETGNFFAADNLNVLAVGLVSLTAGTVDGFSRSASPSDAMNNLIVLVWSQDAQAQGATLDLENFKLEEGSTATPFRPRPLSDELGRCLRYYEHSFVQGALPAQDAGSAGAHSGVQVVGASASTSLGGPRFRRSKRKPPSVSLYNPSAANGLARDATANADCGATQATNVSAEGFALTVTTAAGSAPGDAIMVHWSADAEI